MEWSTSGFQIKNVQTGISLPSTGPLTFWANLAPLVSSTAPIATKLQVVEQYIHQTLISHLVAIDHWAFIQDPPANVLVTDPNGLQTGVTATGQMVDNIPGATYLSSGSVNGVLIMNPADGTYQTQVIGDPSSAFSLVEQSLDVTGNLIAPYVNEQDETGTLGPSGINTYSFQVTSAPPIVPLTPCPPWFQFQHLGPHR